MQKRPINRSLQFAMAACLASAIYIGMAAVADKKADIEYRLLPRDRYADKSNVNIQFMVTNLTSNAFRVLKWNTLFEPISGAILIIRCDGKLLPYQGPVMKRGKPASDDYLLLPPNGELETPQINLSEVYEFPAKGDCVADIEPLYFRRAFEAEDAPPTSEIALKGQPARFKIG